MILLPLLISGIVIKSVHRRTVSMWFLADQLICIILILYAIGACHLEMNRAQLSRLSMKCSSHLTVLILTLS